VDDTLSRLSAALKERYTILSQAGQGGMATVYKATDLKHRREVAIKVLRPELAATIGSERFLQEIDLSARLQHPHIVPLYDSGDAGGILYYVMPFVEGESVRDRLNRETRIPFAEAVTLTREAASALSYAHSHGIVHRDIKPENIMLSGGHAVVTDFGIARALTAAQQDSTHSLTGLGLAIGSPGYMSPEQATASTVDEKSDQYSLACVFYEMVSGQAPFAGPTVQAVLARSLTGPRPRLSKADRVAPPEVDRPVARALDPDPARRFASVTEFAAQLERAAGHGAEGVAERRRLRRLAVGLPLAVSLLALGWILFGPQRRGPVVAGAESIAVLPFSTSGGSVALMGEGMVDLLSTNLNAVGGLRAVDPRLVLARWKKAGHSGGADLETALAVARSVKAQSALIGSIVATGPTVRLSADLYGQDGKSLSHAQVDGPQDSVLALVDRLSLALVREIWRSKEPVPSLRVSGLTTGSLAAMRDYLTGEQFYRRSEWDSAAAAFQRAIDQDSTFALAHYRLAMALGWKGGYATPRAHGASQAASRFSGKLPPREKTLVAAYRLFSDGKLAAVDTMRRYVAAWPDDVEGWNLLGETQFHTNQLTGYSPKELEEPFDRVLALDSTLAPSAIHPLETTLRAGDSAGFFKYLALYRRSAASSEADAYAAAGDIVWGHPSMDSATAQLLQNHMGATTAALMEAQAGPSVSGKVALDRMLGALKAAQGTNPGDQALFQIAMARGLMFSSVGRFAEAERLADSLSKTAVGEQAYGILILPAALGVAPPGFAQHFLESFEHAPLRSPFQAYLLSAILLARGDAQRAGRILDSAVRDSLKYPEFLRGAYQGGLGWRALLAGDTATGIRLLRTGTERIGGNAFFSAPLRLQLGAALTARPDTRDEGLKLLRYGFVSDLGVLPVAYFALGRAADAAGRREDATLGYGQFVRLWDSADSTTSLRLKEARDALSRLTGEPRP
jgi:serine/threonine-protein kinase